jgi:uncharacterized circularly permuted ATP-grasp superfamily protein
MRAPDGRVRLAYADFAELLDGLSIESLVTKQIAAEELFRRLGITFAVYADGGSTERLIPFDLIPRILDRAEWELVERGCTGEGDQHLPLRHLSRSGDHQGRPGAP